MKLANRTFLLVVLALQAVAMTGGPQVTRSLALASGTDYWKVKSLEESCRKEKLNAIGKAFSCRMAAEGSYATSAKKAEDKRKLGESVDLCARKLKDSYTAAARRSGPTPCDPSGTAAEAEAALKEAAQGVLVVTDTTPPYVPSASCSAYTSTDGCSTIPNVTSATCGNYYLTPPYPDRPEGCLISCQFPEKCSNGAPCAPGTDYCSCNYGTVCTWSNGSCFNGGAYCQ